MCLMRTSTGYERKNSPRFFVSCFGKLVACGFVSFSYVWPFATRNRRKKEPEDLDLVSRERTHEDPDARRHETNARKSVFFFFFSLLIEKFRVREKNRVHHDGCEELVGATPQKNFVNDVRFGMK